MPRSPQSMPCPSVKTSHDCFERSERTEFDRSENTESDRSERTKFGGGTVQTTRRNGATEQTEPGHNEASNFAKGTGNQPGQGPDALQPSALAQAKRNKL